MKKEYGILIDSSACIDENYRKEHDIHVVPLSLSDGANKVYADNHKDIADEDLMTRMDNGEFFKTSATPLGILTMEIEDMLEEYEKVIFIPLSAGMSSQYQQSLIIKADHPNNLFVVKTDNGCSAVEFLLPYVYQWIEQKIPPNQIVKNAEDFNYKVSTYCSCEDVRGMITGGRIGNAVLKFIDFIHSKPVFRVDGNVKFTSIAKNYRSAVVKMIKAIKKHYKPVLQPADVKNIAIYDTGYEAEKKNFILDTLAAGFSFLREKIVVRTVPTVVLAHARRGAYGITVETSRYKKDKKN